MSRVFVLRPRIALIPLAAASVTAMLGAVGLVAAVAAGWPFPAAAVPGLVMILSLVLLVATVVGQYRGRLKVSLTDQGFQMVQGRRVVTGQLSEISKVTVADNRLVLVDKADPETGQVILSPRGAADPEFLALQRALAAALDNDRGYHSPQE